MEFKFQDGIVNCESTMPEDQGRTTNLKSLLKKVRNKHSIRQRRVTFDDLVTYYTDDEVHVLSLRTPETNDVFCMFEPPPEYQDFLPFEPPEGYKDQEGSWDSETGTSGDETDTEKEQTWEEQRTSFVEDSDDGKEEIRTNFGCSETESENDSADAAGEEGESELDKDSTDVGDESEIDKEDSTEVVDESDQYDSYNLEMGLLKQLEEDAIDVEGMEDFVFPISVDVSRKDQETTEVPKQQPKTQEIPSIENVDSRDDDDDDDELMSGTGRSNSQIRKIMEKNAFTCNLLKGIEAKKRHVKRPKSPLLSTQSIVEQLRWLTTVDDEPLACVSADKPSVRQSATSQVQRTVRYPPKPVPNQDVVRVQPTAKRNTFRAHFERSLRHHAAYGSVQYQSNQSIRVIPGGNDKEQRIEIKLRQIKTRSQSPRCASDELERFVQQDLERIERIRKRYSIAEEEDDPTFGFARRPSVRGIRPRFGSTSEILKQIQTQLQSPPMPHTRPSDRHMIWTYANRRELHHMSIPANQIVSKEREKKAGKDKRYYSHTENTVTGSYVWCDKKSKILLNATNPLYSLPANQGSSCQDERGAPEGASSSPKVSYDSLYPVEGDEKPPNKDGVIYYSLNV